MVLEFDLSDETIRRTTFDNPLGKVHIEPALRYGDRLGGHVIAGHVHGVGIFCSCDRKTGEMRILLPKSEFSYFKNSLEPGSDESSHYYLLTFKSSIAIDGISLTVSNVDVDTGMITIALIPHTLQNTLFGTMRSGTLVNVKLNCDLQQVTNEEQSVTSMNDNGSTNKTASSVIGDETTNLTKQPPASLCSLSVEEQAVLSRTRVCIVQAEWHRHLGDPLVHSILSLLAQQYGIDHTDIKHVLVPGSLELPRAIQHINDTRQPEPSVSAVNMIDTQQDHPVVYLAVGILIKGDSDHSQWFYF